jgi:hypothetical protein
MATVFGESKCGGARLQVAVTHPQKTNKKPRLANSVARNETVSVKTACV